MTSECVSHWSLQLAALVHLTIILPNCVLGPVYCPVILPSCVIGPVYCPIISNIAQPQGHRASTLPNHTTCPAHCPTILQALHIAQPYYRPCTLPNHISGPAHCPTILQALHIAQPYFRPCTLPNHTSGPAHCPTILQALHIEYNVCVDCFRALGSCSAELLLRVGTLLQEFTAHETVIDSYIELLRKDQVQCGTRSITL